MTDPKFTAPAHQSAAQTDSFTASVAPSKPQPALVLGFEPFSRAGNLMGGLMIALSMSLFVCNDTIMRSLQDVDNPFGVAPLDLPFIIALRGTLVVLLMAVLITASRQWVRPRVLANPWSIARALIEATITVLFLSALPHIPLAAAETLISASPIFLVLMGIALFGEQVKWRRWLAIGLGFVGIVLVSLALDDGGFDAEKFRWWAVPFCLICAVLVAARDVVTRYVPATIPPVGVAFVSALGVLVLGWTWGLGSLNMNAVNGGGWARPDAYQSFLLLCSASLVMTAYLTAVFAVRLGVFAVIGPLRFVSIAVAFILGLALFRDPFSWLGLAGTVLIILSALWIVLRQAQQRD